MRDDQERSLHGENGNGHGHSIDDIYLGNRKRLRLLPVAKMVENNYYAYRPHLHTMIYSISQQADKMADSGRLTLASIFRPAEESCLLSIDVASV